MEDKFLLKMKNIIDKKFIIYKKVAVILFFGVLFLMTPAYGATFKGRVIDADTKEPIEGAVVVIYWYQAKATASGENTSLKNVKETLTDNSGKWILKGPRGRKGGNLTSIFTFITGSHYTRPPQFIVFKPGYCPWPKGLEIKACKKNMKGFDVEKTIELPKLTKREDRKRILLGPIGDNEDWKKQREFIKLLNEEMRYYGWSEYVVIEEE